MAVFRDFITEFTPHPETGDLAVRTGVNSIAQSIKNLILTTKYERPFQPDIGAGVRRLLFENFSAQTIDSLKTIIKETVSNHEPRVRVEDVIVIANETSNDIGVGIVYYATGQSTAQTLELILTRVR